MLKLFQCFTTLCAIFSIMADAAYALEVTEDWAAYYNSPWNETDHCTAMVVDSSGNVYLTGNSDDEVYGDNYATVMYDSEGTEQWVARYHGASGGYDDAQAIAQDLQGNVYVTGSSENAVDVSQYTTIKYSPAGTELWVARQEGAERGAAKAIALDNYGNSYIAGWRYTLGSYWDFATVKYSSDGTKLWEATYDGPESFVDEAVDIALSSNGDVFVTGASYTDFGDEADYVTIKYSNDGEEQWTAIYDGPIGSYDYPRDIEVNSDGSVAVTGYSYSSSQSYSCTTIKYNPDGVVLWTARCDIGSSSKGHALEFDSQGNVCVTGFTQGGTADFLTIKYSPDGTELWHQIYVGTGGNSDYAYAIALDEAGNVFVTGECSATGGDTQIATICYDPSGVQQWSAFHDRPAGGTDKANSIGLDGEGNVYVGGSSSSSETSWDYAVVKYVQETGIEHEEGSLNSGILVHPNPATASVSVDFSLSAPSNCTLSVYSLDGRLVETIQSGVLPRGGNVLTWQNSSLPVGVYTIGLSNGSVMETSRVLLLR